MSARKAALSVAASLAVLGTFSLGPPAQADRTDPVIPSQQQVQDAQQAVVAAKRSVGAIQADLDAASARLDTLSVQAQQASEAYNGAIWRWQQAKQAATIAQRRANQYTALAARTRLQLQSIVLSHDTADSNLNAYASLLSTGGTEELLTQLSNDEASEQAMQASYDKNDAQSDLAKVYQARATAALKEANDAKQAAEQARQVAEQAVAAQQQAIAQIAVQRQGLIHELARAQGVSVEVARQRQEGLERLREERLAEQRRQAELQRQAQLERERQQQAQEQRAQERRERRAELQGQQEQQNDPPAAPSTPPPAPAPSGSGNAQDAVNFAYNQLGEPYVWGATGPDSWDCSGLTMAAWNYAGVSLPHYSVAQYYATTPISYSDLRPGDLIFWASDANNPDTIFHVALYIGNDQMIQAPRTGRNVEVQDVWYWESPDFFTRV